jgi:hypothetical protein
MLTVEIQGVENLRLVANRKFLRSESMLNERLRLTAGIALTENVIPQYTRPSRKRSCQRPDRFVLRKSAAAVNMRMVRSKAIAE